MELSNPNGQASADAIKLEPVNAQPSGYQLQGTTEQYLYKDHLGSILLITEQGDGANAVPVAQGMSFDPWGKRRHDSNWTEYSAAALVSFDHSITTRGFTGHEMLDEVGLIHMNGRIYDPHLARFVQADPFVQDPGNVQSLNRYSYVLNNPLNATDPSGFISLGDVFKIAVIAVAAYFTAGWAANAYFTAGAEAAIAAGTVSQATWVALGAEAAIVGGAVGGFTAGALATAFAGGNFKDVVKGGLFGAVSGAAFGAIGQQAWGLPGKALAHGVTGGVMSELQGGKFGHGFISAGFSKLANVNSIIGYGADKAHLRVGLAAILGGTLSDATGGKFANGAVSAAFGQVFNGESDPKNQSSQAGNPKKWYHILGEKPQR
ncbi:MAG: RHS repeat-associated core domain-containing protein [Pseudomonadales bacterium]